MKKWYVLLALLLAAALLASCGGDSVADEPVDDGPASEDIDLVFWTFPVGDWGNPTTVANLLNGFHKENPSIHISVEYLDYDTGDDRINQAVLDGNAPDLVLEGPERLVANWGDQGWMADLSDLW